MQKIENYFKIHVTMEFHAEIDSLIQCVRMLFW